MEKIVTAEKLEKEEAKVAAVFYEHYDALIDLICPDYRELIDAAAGAVPAWARTVVDLGCGTGTLMAALAARRPSLAHMTGIDLNQALLDEAAGRLGALLPGSWTLLCGDILKAPLPVADVYLSSLVLHNLGAVEQAMAYRRVAAASQAFIVFDVVAGADEAEERQRWEYLDFALADKGIDDDFRRFIVEHMRESDRPLSLAQHRDLCDAVGLDLRVIKTAPGFALFKADRR